MIEFIKFLERIFFPPAILIVALCIGVYFVQKGRERQANIIFFSVIVVGYFFSIEPTAYLLNQTLERSVLRPITERISSPEESFIVVLASGATHSPREYATTELNGSSLKRFWKGIELYFQLERKIPILYTGYSSPTPDYGKQESVVAQEYALQIGIPPKDFFIDQESRTTYESALFTKKFLDQKFLDKANHQIFLVTSAQHMPRSQEVFRRKGIEVVPVIADFSGRITPLTKPIGLLPSADSLSASVSALHEWVGRIAYYFYP